MPRETLINLLLTTGKDEEDLQILSDEELQDLYDEIFDEDPSLESREELISQLVDSGEDEEELVTFSTSTLNEMYEESLDDSDMFPNGRDYDAEDFDD